MSESLVTDPHSLQLMAVFLKQYHKASEQIRSVHDWLDNWENRAVFAKLFPEVSKSVERQTRGEIESKLEIVHIASAVAETVLQARHILRE